MFKRGNVSREEAFQKACKENGIRINVNGRSSKPFIVKRDDGNYIIATDKKVVAVKKSISDIKALTALNSESRKAIVSVGLRKEASGKTVPIVRRIKSKNYYEP